MEGKEKMKNVPLQVLSKLIQGSFRRVRDSLKAHKFSCSSALRVDK